MQHIAALVETWLLQGRDAAVVRPIGAPGLGPRSVEDLLLVARPGRSAGALLGGPVQPQVLAAVQELSTTGVPQLAVKVRIDDDDASAAGLTCGGRAELLAQRLDAIPATLWDALAARRAAALITVLGRTTN